MNILRKLLIALFTLLPMSLVAGVATAQQPVYDCLDLQLAEHHSVKLRIGIDDKAGLPGGINIFGRGFGNHDQDIKMRLHLVKKQ